MPSIGQFAMFGIASCAIALTACTAEPSGSEAPDAVLDSLDESDEGASWNGWTQSHSGWLYAYLSFTQVSHTLSRSFGDNTRGGGACFVRSTGVGCSSDATCLGNAQAQYGASAWGYCYSGSCYSRPGAQATYCSLNPNRGAGTVTATFPSTWPVGNEYALGCMTKTAGPNTSCAGTNASLYMRLVTPQQVSWANP
jgi:hypothetical protein